MTTSQNVYQRMHAAMKAVPYVKKDVAITGGKGVARDAVVAEIRRALLEAGLVVHTSQVGPGRFIDSGQKSSSGTPKTVYVAMYETRFVNIDDPTQFVPIQHEAQGDDYGDKSPGKAATYAEKLNLVKGLMLETGIADEGRNHDEGDDATKALTPERRKEMLDAVEKINDAKALQTYFFAAQKDVKAHGGNADMIALTEACSKRKGVIQAAKKAAAEAETKAKADASAAEPEKEAA